MKRLYNVLFLCTGNPAVTVARSLTSTFSGIAARDVPAFVAMQVLGAALAAVVVRAVNAPDRR